MSLLFRAATMTAAEMIAERRGRGRNGSVVVGADSALRSSAVWACLRLRADLISTMPVDAFRRVAGVQVEMTKPPVLVNPGGAKVDITEWLYSSQVDLDRSGNDVGIVTALDGYGKPARIELVPLSDVTGRGKGGEIVEWKIGSKTYTPAEVWHEKQFTVPGMPFGLSPVMYAAWSIGGYLSAQQFALDWFEKDANPSGVLQSTTNDVIGSEVAQDMKDRFKESVAGRDLFVTGKAWEYKPIAADAGAAAFLEQMRYGVTDIARFFGVPGDMIDAEGGSSTITYANVTQRNLQLLVLNLGPAIVRREKALSRLLPEPRFVKFNTDAVLRLDPLSVTQNLAAQVTARLRTPDEGRALLNMPPLEEADYAQFDRLFTKGTQAPQQVTKDAENGARA